MDPKDSEKNERTNFSRFCRPSSVLLMSSWYPSSSLLLSPEASSSSFKKTFLGCQWNGIFQMNKALTSENERRILRRMKSNFFLHEWKKRKMTLFGILYPSPTFKSKMQPWLEVRNQLVDAGFLSRTKEQLKRKWEEWSSATKAKYAHERRLGVVQ